MQVIPTSKIQKIIGRELPAPVQKQIIYISVEIWVRDYNSLN